MLLPWLLHMCVRARILTVEQFKMLKRQLWELLDGSLATVEK
jgi:hypothetical protein